MNTIKHMLCVLALLMSLASCYDLDRMGRNPYEIDASNDHSHSGDIHQTVMLPNTPTST